MSITSITGWDWMYWLSTRPSLQSPTTAHEAQGGKPEEIDEYYYGNGSLLAMKVIDHPEHGLGHYKDELRGISFYHLDALGSVAMLTGRNGQVVERYEYDAYGHEYNGKFEQNQNKANPYGFTGQRFETELGVYSFAFRDYNPRAMRWATEDPIKDGMNWYQYCNGDPINFIDPLGLYDRIAAVDYAHQWAKGRNPDYNLKRGLLSIKGWPDCTNFTSQVLNAGGIAKRSDWYFNKGKYDWKGSANSYSNSWTVADDLADWLRSKPDILESEITLNRGFTVDDVKKFVGNVEVGDLIGWARGSNGDDIHHFGIITKIENGRIYYSGHTSNRSDQLFSMKTFELTDQSAVIFHIKDCAK